ncbi:helix-turn-helix domain-containing protein [Roseateles sp. 22389]|uniref:helix-turn-helix domain-containing protein n=1 Tax=Roseateles sp. 22389 TaxID=3453916 RepID=UPI003F876BDB
MEPAEAFGRALRHRRREASLSQEQLALEAGLERVFISWLETGRQQPSFQTMLKLSGALKCTAADLVAEAESLMAEAR